MAKKNPKLAKLNKAIKLLEQFDRLAEKFGIGIPQRRLDRLRKLRDSGTIQSDDPPGKLLREFPDEFVGMSLNEIRQAKVK